MTKQSAQSDASVEPSAEAERDARQSTQPPSDALEVAVGPSADATDDVCKCGAPRSMKNVERCMRGHPMPGTVLNPNARGSANQSRVEQLEKMFTEDYKPQTHRQRMEVLRLAAMWEQRERLERTEAGSIEHQRLDAIVQALVDRLETSQFNAANEGTQGGAVVILPDNHREWDQRVERGDDQLRELLGRTPGVSETQSTAKPAPAAADTFTPPTVIERVVTRNRFGECSSTRSRPIAEAEVEACLEASGDLDAYRAGRISRERAYDMTRSWLVELIRDRDGLIQ